MTYCKKFFIAILIFLFVFCFTSSVFATNPQPVDPTGSFTTSQGGYSEQRDNVYDTLLEYQANVQRRFISKCYANIDNSSYKTVLVRLYDQFKGMGSNGKFFVFSENYSGYDSSYTVYTAYTGDLSRSVTNQFVIDNTAFSHVATYTGTFYDICGIANDAYVTNPVYSKTVTLTQPVAFCRSLVPEFIQLFKDFGLIENEQLAQILTALINCQNSLIVLRNQNTNLGNFIKNEGSQTRQEIQNSTDKINDNLNNNDTSEVDTSGITNSDTTVDITQDGFNSIFTTLQTYFTSNNGGSLTLTIPFVNKSITISKATVYGNFKQLSTIENLASLAWYFVISLYIVKQVQKMINKIKSGNLEDVVDNNIKADIL